MNRKLLMLRHTLYKTINCLDKRYNWTKKSFEILQLRTSSGCPGQGRNHNKTFRHVETLFVQGRNLVPTGLLLFGGLRQENSGSTAAGEQPGD